MCDRDTTDADDLAREQDLRTDTADHDFGHACGFLFDDAAQHCLAVDDQHRVEQERDHQSNHTVASPGPFAPLVAELRLVEFHIEPHQRVDASGVESGALQAKAEHRLVDGSAKTRHLAHRSAVAADVPRLEAQHRA